MLLIGCSWHPEDQHEHLPWVVSDRTRFNTQLIWIPAFTKIFYLSSPKRPRRSATMSCGITVYSSTPPNYWSLNQAHFTHLMFSKPESSSNLSPWVLYHPILGTITSFAVTWLSTGAVVTDRAILSFEKKCADQLRATNMTAGTSEQRICYAIRVDFLVGLCFVLNLWRWTTLEVVIFLVKACTEEWRCRFALHPAVLAYSGHSDVIMSHAWNNSFGTLAPRN